jgi:hypothetical protein
MLETRGRPVERSSRPILVEPEDLAPANEEAAQMQRAQNAGTVFGFRRAGDTRGVPLTDLTVHMTATRAPLSEIAAPLAAEQLTMGAEQLAMGSERPNMDVERPGSLFCRSAGYSKRSRISPRKSNSPAG